MRLWTVALIVGVGCASAERDDTTHADLARREEAPSPEPAPVPASEYKWHERDGGGVAAPAVAEAPPKAPRPFDLTSAKVVHAGCVPWLARVPDETRKCLGESVVIGDCGSTHMNSIGPPCFKRIEDGALTWMFGYPSLTEDDGWAVCNAADWEKRSWPSCGD
ncbi:MAG: hypothetical protein KF795_01715 [Labilithrix sp.]|nr:hypothetical protein [Labilithrix sp.]